MQNIILILNLIASIASAAWGVIGLIRPAMLSGTAVPERGERFYARMYAARAIPFGLLVGILPFSSSSVACASLLFTAAVVQLADVAIALIKKRPGMVFGAFAGAFVHLVCGVVVMRMIGRHH